MVLDIKLDKHGGLDATKSRSLDKLNELINILELEDIWRLKHGNIKRFTWRQKNPRVQCRLDYFLISTNVTDLVVESTILPSILSDHSPIAVTLKYIPEPTRGPGHWKLNVSLLKEEGYKTQIRHNIAAWLEKYKNLDNENLKWDLMTVQ